MAPLARRGLLPAAGSSVADNRLAGRRPAGNTPWTRRPQTGWGNRPGFPAAGLAGNRPADPDPSGPVWIAWAWPGWTPGRVAVRRRAQEHAGRRPCHSLRDPSWRK